MWTASEHTGIALRSVSADGRELALATSGYLALIAALVWEGERLADPLPVAVIGLVAGIGMVAAGALAGRWWFVAINPAVAAALAFGPEPGAADVSLW